MDSIMRHWANRSVKGRDVVATVTIKGHLLPSGHSVSLFLVTERVFVLQQSTPAAKISQRAFIQLSQPSVQIQIEPPPGSMTASGFQTNFAVTPLTVSGREMLLASAGTEVGETTFRASVA